MRSHFEIIIVLISAYPGREEQIYHTANSDIKCLSKLKPCVLFHVPSPLSDRKMWSYIRFLLYDSALPKENGIRWLRGRIDEWAKEYRDFSNGILTMTWFWTQIYLAHIMKRFILAFFPVVIRNCTIIEYILPSVLWAINYFWKISNFNNPGIIIYKQIDVKTYTLLLCLYSYLNEEMNKILCLHKSLDQM